MSKVLGWMCQCLRGSGDGGGDGDGKQAEKGDDRKIRTNVRRRRFSRGSFLVQMLGWMCQCFRGSADGDGDGDGDGWQAEKGGEPQVFKVIDTLRDVHAAAQGDASSAILLRGGHRAAQPDAETSKEEAPADDAPTALPAQSCSRDKPDLATPHKNLIDDDDMLPDCAAALTANPCSTDKPDLATPNKNLNDDDDMLPDCAPAPTANPCSTDNPDLATSNKNLNDDDDMLPDCAPAPTANPCSTDKPDLATPHQNLNDDDVMLPDCAPAPAADTCSADAPTPTEACPIESHSVEYVLPELQWVNQPTAKLPAPGSISDVAPSPLQGVLQNGPPCKPAFQIPSTVVSMSPDNKFSIRVSLRPHDLQGPAPSAKFTNKK